MEFLLRDLRGEGKFENSNKPCRSVQPRFIAEREEKRFCKCRHPAVAVHLPLFHPQINITYP